MNQLVTVDAKEFGLEKSEAKQIEAVFTPMLEKMTDLEQQFNEVVSLPMNDETCQRARALRLKYVKIRTGTAKIHKKAKAYYLAGGRFVDGWKNAQAFASQGKEEQLEKIEKHYEILEEKRIAELEEERLALLDPYEIDASGLKLGEMEEDVWENFFAGTKMRHEEKLEAERKAEQERIAAEEAEKERQRKQAEENARLKAEAEKREREIAEERKKAEAERKIAEEKARREREEAEKARMVAEAKARKEREKRERAEREAAESEIRKALSEAKAKSELNEIRIIFDGPPGPVPGRFVEVENTEGASIRVGEWHGRGDGFHELRIKGQFEAVKLPEVMEEMTLETVNQ